MSMKTAEEILFNSVKDMCPDDLKPYTQDDYKKWLSDGANDAETILHAMREFAAQEVEIFKYKLKDFIS